MARVAPPLKPLGGPQKFRALATQRRVGSFISPRRRQPGDRNASFRSSATRPRSLVACDWRPHSARLSAAAPGVVASRRARVRTARLVDYGAGGMGLRKIQAQLGEYFLSTCRPLDGRLRLLVLGLLSVQAAQRLFETSARLMLTCPAGFYEPSGLLAYLGPADPQLAGEWLVSLRPLIHGMLVLSTIGFLGRAPLILSAIAYFYATGFEAGCTGTGHAWFVPTYTMLILAMFQGTTSYSVDAYLAKRWPSYPFRPSPEHELLGSGLARSLCLLVVAGVMFAAGVAKLREGGMSWISGESLISYLHTKAAPKPWALGFYEWLLAHPAAIRVLSLLTLILELGAPLIVFDRSLRLPFVVLSWGFHLGIMALMLPRYFPQMTCYLLILESSDLPWLRRKETDKAPEYSSRALKLSAWAATFWIACFAGVIVWAREYYPLSHIPMYSTRLTSTHIGEHEHQVWSQKDGLRSICKEYQETRKPWIFPTHVGRKISIFYRRGTRGEWRHDLPMAHVRGNIFLWLDRAARAFASDLTNRDPVAIELGSGEVLWSLRPHETGKPSESEALLDRLKETAQLRGLGGKDARLDLFYGDGQLRFWLGSLSLDPDHPARPTTP